jgi:putative inorganic carbon (hco3(-)) transporter
LRYLRLIAEFVLRLEPVLLAVMVYAFWYPNETRVWSLLVLVPLGVARLLVYGRLFTRTPLDIPLLAFLVLGVINVVAAPYTRGLVMLGRPIMGMALVYSAVEAARRTSSMNGLTRLTLAMGILLAVIALTTSQWTQKSIHLMFLIDPLPDWRSLPVITGGFNVNEIAGALTWLVVFAAAIAVYAWRLPSTPNATLPRAAATVAFGLLLFALFLGQSRFALFGVILALALVIFALIPPGRWRWAALAALVAFTVLELIVFTGFLLPAGDVNTERDEESWTSRLNVWGSAAAMIRDYPLTGVGMSMYRDSRVRAIYPVPGYEQRPLPHAHNELLQVGADLGVPGLAVFVIWHAVLGWMLWQTWRRGDAFARAVAVGCTGSLLAHAFFGLGDAITLWDRFTFLYWWVVGLVAAQYTVVVRAVPEQQAVSAEPMMANQAGLEVA